MKEIQEKIMEKIRLKYQGRCTGCPFVVKCYKYNREICKKES